MGNVVLCQVSIDDDPILGAYPVLLGWGWRHPVPALPLTAVLFRVYSYKPLPLQTRRLQDHLGLHDLYKTQIACQVYCGDTSQPVCVSTGSFWTVEQHALPFCT